MNQNIGQMVENMAKSGAQFALELFIPPLSSRECVP